MILHYVPSPMSLEGGSICPLGKYANLLNYVNLLSFGHGIFRLIHIFSTWQNFMIISLSLGNVRFSIVGARSTELILRMLCRSLCFASRG